MLGQQVPNKRLGGRPRYGIQVQVRWYNASGVYFIRANFNMAGSNTADWMWDNDGNQVAYGNKDIACAQVAWDQYTCSPAGVMGGLYAINAFR